MYLDNTVTEKVASCIHVLLYDIKFSKKSSLIYCFNYR